MKIFSAIIIIAIIGLFLSKNSLENDVWTEFSKCISKTQSKDNVESLIKTIDNRKNETTENLTKRFSSNIVLYINVWKSAKEDQDLKYDSYNWTYENCDEDTKLIRKELTKRYKEKIILLDSLHTNISLNERYINLIQKIDQAEESRILVENLFDNLSIIEGN